MVKTFGDFIRERRDALDLSVREFAKKLGGISPAHISDIENGRRFPSDDLLKRMAPVLEVSIDELQKHDLRPPVEELRRMVQRNPTYGVALRKLTEKQVSADELLKFLDKKSK
jgi:transcriptional regulator with XRE-family HTH domain